MDNQKFVELAKKAVVGYFNSRKEITDEGLLTKEDVYRSIKKLQKNGQRMYKNYIVQKLKYEQNYNFISKKGYI